MRSSLSGATSSTVPTREPLEEADGFLDHLVLGEAPLKRGGRAARLAGSIFHVEEVVYPLEERRQRRLAGRGSRHPATSRPLTDPLGDVEPAFERAPDPPLPGHRVPGEEQPGLGRLA